MLDQVFINGERAEARIPLRALFFGEGVFETFRFKSRMPLFFDRHYDRMARGAGLLRIPLMNREGLADLIDKALSGSGISDAYVKVCLLSEGGLAYFHEPERGDVAVVVREYDSRNEPIKVCINKFRRVSASPIRSIKSLNYLENIIARREAEANGYDEAVLLNERGEVTECTASNIFWVSKDTLFTPSVECGILPGIIREILIDSIDELGLSVEEGEYRPECLIGSRLAFLTNSLSGSILISRLGETALPSDGELYEAIKKLLSAKLGWI